MNKMQEAKRNGLSALAITEHFNAGNIIEFYDMLQQNFSYKEEYYMIEGIKVFCGLEIDVKENGHFLVIGSRDDIMTISRMLYPYHDKKAFISVIDLLALLTDFNVLKIGAHQV
ncbi:PHP domain protein [Oceanobacillus oncorhynchi]|uniref:PHP domain protein n=1 Tax=Oceanobacillus oncorhynchi TaxID=545501 RepID=A0A0A1M6I4_9BACI|nr:PHP domain-containing protein [Oceanobacillus oncorhynchi]CEI80885.1 PHP domain protein [Oceanobacillus oncorhynchi]